MSEEDEFPSMEVVGGGASARLYSWFWKTAVRRVWRGVWGHVRES